ncbi:MAG: hypothetical protein CSB55_02700 [Candidatus Cloacimonadota bacterium]|nr:MAG: hypothetical protein CSB55_02700 [Candidatus Cloacimonadota bacterium]
MKRADKILKVSMMFFLFLSFSILSSIEVGGHLTEDTIWSPDNNPYIITSNLFVDEGVTLRILPGTEIYLSAAEYKKFWDFVNFSSSPDGHSVAKFIWVDGKIIAEGTENKRILITRLQDIDEYFWGTIYISENAEMCRFKYCRFEYAQKMFMGDIDVAEGAISVRNRTGLFKDNIFCNCHFGITFRKSPSFAQDILRDVEITNNKFYYTDNTNLFGYNYGGRFAINLYPSQSDELMPLICNNQFDDLSSDIRNSVCAFNTIRNSRTGFNAASAKFVSARSNYIYKNNIENCRRGLNIKGKDSVYVKGNRIIGNKTELLNAESVYLEISDNYFQGGYVNLSSPSSKYLKNTLNDGNLSTAGNVEMFNNCSYNGKTSYGMIEQAFSTNKRSINNNLSINNKYAFDSSFQGTYNNCIFIGNENIQEYAGTPVFRNCITDFELPEGCIDGGGNITVDSSEAQQIFADIENGDFRLAENSIATDAGFDTTGYFPADLENSVRVWDGDGDGISRIDIGAYEYGSPQLGKLTGYITETITGEPVDYVLIKPDNNSIYFTVADSTGYFEAQLPEGNYDLSFQRVFYESAVAYNIPVKNEQTTEISFNMKAITDFSFQSPNPEQIVDLKEIKTKCSPNPFNPFTVIYYTVPSDGEIDLSIFNIKGQKVKTLVSEFQKKGNYSVKWNGKDNHDDNLASGVYFYKIQTGNSSAVNKILMLK